MPVQPIQSSFCCLLCRLSHNQTKPKNKRKQTKAIHITTPANQNPHSLLQHRRNRPPGIHQNEFLNPFVHIRPVLSTFPGRDARLVHVKVKDADLAVEAAVARVAAEARRASVAHPEGRLVLLRVGEAAVFVYVVAVAGG